MRFARKVVLAVGAVFGLTLQTPVLMAQAVQHSMEARSLDFSVTYNAQRGGTTGGGSFWLQGGAMELAGTLYRGLGFAAQFAGGKSSNIGNDQAGTTPVGLTILTGTFGPRYTWRVPAKSRVRNLSLFGQSLVGFAHGENGVFPTPYGAQNNACSSALVTGGGANYVLNRTISIRVVQAEWLRTDLQNGASNVENSFRIGAGIVFRIR
jgi:outer membrane immunogenic protein